MINNDVKKIGSIFGWENQFRASQNNFQIIKDLNIKNQIVKILGEI